MPISNRPRRPSRKLVGGSDFNTRIDEIQDATRIITGQIETANETIAQLVKAIETKKNIPFYSALLIGFTGLSQKLTTIQRNTTIILDAIQEIDRTTQEMVRRQSGGDG